MSDSPESHTDVAEKDGESDKATRRIKLPELTGENGVRWMMLIIILVADAVLLFVSLLGNTKWAHDLARLFSPFDLDALGAASRYKVSEWVALVTPGIMPVLASFAHWRDDVNLSYGVKGRLKKTVGKYAYDLSPDVIGASMTKQSVLAAVAAVLGTLLQTQIQTEGPFSEDMKQAATVGFVFSIIFLLVSMVCYDYAGRFRWSTFYKAQLVRKALRLDVLSWYVLLSSFVLTIAVRSPKLSVLAGVAAGLLMWWYYFFPRGGPGDHIGVRGVAAREIRVRDLSKAEEFYARTLGLDVLARDGGTLTLRAGGWTEIVLSEDKAAAGSQRVTFTLPDEDLQYAWKALGEIGAADLKAEPEKPTPKNKVTRITLKDPDGNVVELREPLKKSAG